MVELKSDCDKPGFDATYIAMSAFVAAALHRAIQPKDVFYSSMYEFESLVPRPMQRISQSGLQYK